LEPSKLTVKAGCDRKPTGDSQDGQVYVYAKTTLTVIFHRFDPAPVERMARTGLSPRAQQEDAKVRNEHR
jgi:hypothetical protein